MLSLRQLLFSLAFLALLSSAKDAVNETGKAPALDASTADPKKGPDGGQQTCAQSFTGSWIDSKKVKQWGYACSLTGNVKPNDVYQCKKVVSEAQAKGCGPAKKESNCGGGFSFVITDSKTKETKNPVFCRESAGSKTMKCETMVRPATLGDCVKSSAHTYEEHKNDWLAHAA